MEEKMLNIANHQGNEYQDHDEILPHTCQNGCNPKDTNTCWQGCGDGTPWALPVGM